MKATMLCASAVVALACAAPQLAAFPPYNYSPVFRQRLGVAPDMSGPGYYSWCPSYCNAPYPNGGFYGPNYCVYPPFPPVGGIPPGAFQNGGAGGTPVTTRFPYHPYMRGPRDFFMWREAMEDAVRRDFRPNLVP